MPGDTHYFTSTKQKEMKPNANAIWKSFVKEAVIRFVFGFTIMWLNSI